MGFSLFFGETYYVSAQIPMLRSTTLNLTHIDNASNAVTSMHVMERLIDAAKVLSVGDELINLELAVHVVVDQAAHLAAALDTTEGTALPHASGNELECCSNILAHVRAHLLK